MTGTVRESEHDGGTREDRSTIKLCSCPGLKPRCPDAPWATSRHKKPTNRKSYLEFFGLRHDVGFDVELGEEDEEEDSVGTDEVGELPREFAVVVEHLDHSFGNICRMLRHYIQGAPANFEIPIESQ